MGGSYRVSSCGDNGGCALLHFHELKLISSLPAQLTIRSTLLNSFLTGLLVQLLLYKYSDSEGKTSSLDRLTVGLCKVS